MFAVDHVKLEVKLAVDTMVVVRLALLLIAAALAVGVSLLALDVPGFHLIRQDLAIGVELENCAAETRRDSWILAGVGGYRDGVSRAGVLR